MWRVEAPISDMVGRGADVILILLTASIITGPWRDRERIRKPSMMPATEHTAVESRFSDGRTGTKSIILQRERRLR